MKQNGSAYLAPVFSRSEKIWCMELGRHLAVVFWTSDAQHRREICDTAPTTLLFFRSVPDLLPYCIPSCLRTQRSPAQCTHPSIRLVLVFGSYCMLVRHAQIMKSLSLPERVLYSSVLTSLPTVTRNCSSQTDVNPGITTQLRTWDM